jgi:hypothetical protein
MPAYESDDDEAHDGTKQIQNVEAEKGRCREAEKQARRQEAETQRQSRGKGAKRREIGKEKRRQGCYCML